MRLPAVAMAALFAATLLATWEMAASLGLVSNLFFPPPTETTRALVRMVASGDLLAHIAATLGRVVSGFLIGGTVGVSVGAAMALSPPLGRFLDPLVAATHPMPKVTLLPIAILVLGIGEAPRVALVALATFYPMLIATWGGVKEIPPLYFDVARSFRASRLQVFRRVVVPGALPPVLNGARIAANIALVITLSVELIFGERGIGRVIWFSWQTLRMDEMFAALAATALLGLAGNALLQWLASLLLRWRAQD